MPALFFSAPIAVLTALAAPAPGVDAGIDTVVRVFQDALKQQDRERFRGLFLKEGIVWQEVYGEAAILAGMGYRVDEGKLGPAENNISYALGSGEVYATAADLHRWGRALLGDRLLQAASRKARWAGARADRRNYAYGFYVQPYRRSGDAMGTVVRHGGTMDGFTSNFHLYLEDDLNVIVLANLRSLKMRDLTYQLKEAALGRPPAPRQAGRSDGEGWLGTSRHRRFFPSGQ